MHWPIWGGFCIHIKAQYSVDELGKGAEPFNELNLKNLKCSLCYFLCNKTFIANGNNDSGFESEKVLNFIFLVINACRCVATLSDTFINPRIFIYINDAISLITGPRVIHLLCLYIWTLHRTWPLLLSLDLGQHANAVFYKSITSNLGLYINQFPRSKHVVWNHIETPCPLLCRWKNKEPSWTLCQCLR